MEVHGRNLIFMYDVIYEGKSYKVTIDGQLEGEKFRGTMNVGEFGQFPVDGKKDPKH